MHLECFFDGINLFWVNFPSHFLLLVVGYNLFALITVRGNPTVTVTRSARSGVDARTRFRPLPPAFQFRDDMELALHEPLLIVLSRIPKVHQTVADLDILLPDPFD